MNESMQDQVCLESQTCCEGGRRPVSQAQLTAECGCENGCVRCSTNGETVYRRPFSERKSMREFNPDYTWPVPPLSQEQVHEVKVISERTDALLSEREKDYGPPDINMTGIGLIWTAQLRNWSGIADFPVIPGTIVALMMTGLKLNRLAKSPDHKDSYDDADGYLEIAKMLNQGK